MPLENHNNIQSLRNIVNQHSETTLENSGGNWLHPGQTLKKLESLNEQKKQLDSKKQEIETKRQRLEELNAEGPEAEQLYIDISLAEEEVEALQKDFEPQYQEAQKYLKLKQENGEIKSYFLYKDQNNVVQEVALSGPNDPILLTQIDVNKLESPKMKFIYKKDVISTVNNIINAFERNEEVSNEDFEKLLAETPDLQHGDAFNVLYQNMWDINFKYNIKRDLTDSLVDIRNIKNFRASNIRQDKNKLSSNQGNFINPTTADGTNASKSFYMSKNDFCWSQNYNDLVDEKNIRENYSIQNIILNQYQPTLQYNIGIEVAAGIDLALAGGAEALKEKGLQKAHAEVFEGLLDAAIEHGLEKLYNDRMETMGKHPERLYAEEHYEDFTNPMYYIEHLFNNGRWLNTYQLPFIASGKVKTDYLKNSSDPGSWNIGGLTDNFSENGFAQKILHNRISLSLPASPTFDLNNPHNSTLSPFSIDFYLINKDDQYLDKNFQLMQALFAGTQWLSMELGVVVATNVYHVLVPGRFQIHWAGMTSQFQAIGKLRTNQHMDALYGTNNGSITRIGMIDKDTLWPEAWHVTLNIRPLTPWNFNTHMAYYLNGFGANQKNRLATMKTSWLNTGLVLSNEEKNKVEDIKKRRDALDTNLKTKQKEMLELVDLMNKTRSEIEFNRLRDEYKKKEEQYWVEVNKAKSIDADLVAADVALGTDERVAQSNMITNQLNHDWLIRTQDRINRTYEVKKDMFIDNGMKSQVMKEVIADADRNDDTTKFAHVFQQDYNAAALEHGKRMNQLSYRINPDNTDQKNLSDEEVDRLRKKEIDDWNAYVNKRTQVNNGVVY